MRPNQNRRGRNNHGHGHGHGHGHRNNNGGGNGGGNRKNTPVRFQTFESKGLEVKVRGNPSQIYEKYMALARDAQSSGDLVRAESHFQHAEHYFRLLNSEPRPQYNAPTGEGAAAEVELINPGEAVVESLVATNPSNTDQPGNGDKDGEAA